MSVSFPALFHEYDAASLRGQKNYLNLIRADVAALLVGAVASAADRPVIAAASLFVAIVLAFFLKRNQARLWYDGRAGAESVKTLAWRFMMRAKPFDGSDDAARARFHEDLGRIAERAIPEQITPEMSTIRALPLDQRRDLYLQQRIEDQRRWYSGRAEQNRRASQKWFVILVLTQALAMATAIAEIVWRIRVTGILTSLAAAVIAWMQVKRFDELVQAYTQAAKDLEKVARQTATTEEQFSNFVADSENAISREHTLWVARRSSE